MPIAINLVLLQRAIKLGCQLDQSGPVTIVDIYIYIYISKADYKSKDGT